MGMANKFFYSSARQRQDLLGIPGTLTTEVAVGSGLLILSIGRGNEVPPSKACNKCLTKT